MNDKKISDEFGGGGALSEEEKKNLGEIRARLTVPVAFNDIEEFKRLIRKYVVKDFGNRTDLAISFLRDAEDEQHGVWSRDFKASLEGETRKAFREFLKKPRNIQPDNDLVQSVFKKRKPDDPSHE